MRATALRAPVTGHVMWPNDLGFGRVPLLLIASFLALVLSLAITMLIGQYGHVVHRIVTPPPELPEKRVYTLEEVQKAERYAMARLQEQTRQWRSQTPAEAFRDFKMNALWGVWLPWFLLALLVRLRTILHVAFILIVPAGAASIKLITLEELLLFVVALAIGMLPRELLARRKRAT